MKNKLKNHGFTQAPAFSKSGAGFTLIEILIVTVIIGVLAAIIFTNTIVVKRSRDAQRKTDLQKIASALEHYRADTGSYPLASEFPTCGSSWTIGSITYMEKVPCDPNGSAWWDTAGWFLPGNYYYVDTSADSDGNSYALYACIENTGDPQGWYSETDPYRSCPTHWVYLIRSP